jgi:hypothetical protein
MSNPHQAHSKLSFSARYRWRACPLSVHLSANVADVPSSPAAEEGTCAHLVAEWYVRQHYRLPFADGSHVAAGECPPTRVPPGISGLDYNDLATISAWHARLRQHGKAYLVFVQSLIPADEPNAHISIETKVDIRSIHPMLFGTLDLRIWLPKAGRLVIVDYKYGFQDVDVGTPDDPNAQLAAYAIASIEALNEQCQRLLSGIRLAVYQPRVPLGDPAKVLDLPVSWVDVERRKLRDEVAAVENPGAPRPGDHCRYCPAKASCPAVHGALGTALSVYAGGPNLLSMSDDQLIALWSARKAVETLMEDLDERVRKLATTGETAKRFKIATRQGNRMFKDKQAATLTLLALGRHDLLQPVALSDALPAMPAALIDELVTRGATASWPVLLESPAPNVVRDMFQKYIEKA